MDINNADKASYVNPTDAEQAAKVQADQNLDVSELAHKKQDGEWGPTMPPSTSSAGPISDGAGGTVTPGNP